MTWSARVGHRTGPAPRRSVGSAPVELEGVGVVVSGPGGTRQVLDGQDLRVEEGALTCVVGRTGSGKSTLLRVATGLLVPSSGTVRWQGEGLDYRRREHLAVRRSRLIGYVPQDHPVLEDMTALENVLLGGGPLPRGAARSARVEEAEALLEDLHLEDVSRSRAGVLSGGERQRVSLARALLAPVPVVCLDEPTSALDEATAQDVVRLLRRHAEQGRAVLVSSHDPVVTQAVDVVHRL